MNASAAVLIISAECAVSGECICEWLIGYTRDSNKVTPATPSADCRNSRRPSALLSFDFFFIFMSSLKELKVSRVCSMPERSLCQSLLQYLTVPKEERCHESWS